MPPDTVLPVTALGASVFNEPMFSRSNVISSPCPIPAAPGVYGWWFDRVPAGVPVEGCLVRGDRTLLYVGISPKVPPLNGRPPSKQTVKTRVRYHYTGNAEGSTLRLTLGVLLAEELGIELRRVGSGTRHTFSTGEQRLSEWMGEHAFVTVSEHPEPWVLEEQLIARWSLPLNLDQNSRSFRPVLSAMRSAAKQRAKELPVLPR
jgi:hypothetical protein